MHKRTAHALIDNDDNVDIFFQESIEESSSQDKTDRRETKIPRENGSSSFEVTRAQLLTFERTFRIFSLFIPACDSVVGSR